MRKLSSLLAIAAPFLLVGGPAAAEQKMAAMNMQFLAVKGSPVEGRVSVDARLSRTLKAAACRVPAKKAGSIVKYGQCWVFAATTSPVGKLKRTACSQRVKYGQCWVFSGLTSTKRAMLDPASCSAAPAKKDRCFAMVGAPAKAAPKPAAP